jgi:hypothetical protein
MISTTTKESINFPVALPMPGIPYFKGLALRPLIQMKGLRSLDVAPPYPT